MVSIVSAFRDLARLRQIYVVLFRHGFGEIARRLGLARRTKDGASFPPAGDAEGLLVDVPEQEALHGEEEKRLVSPAARMRLVLMDLGPSFVKLGQIASTRPDLLPPDWIIELKKLQDEVTPLPFDEIRNAVEISLGQSIDDIYQRFDDKPLAAASIGQVHRAVLRTPEGPKDVVVKVQRPGVRSTIARDLELLHMLAKFIERAIPESRIYSPSGLVDQFDRAITSELDFSTEAENAERFGRNFSGHPHAKFPHVYKEASTKQVVTLEFLPGTKVYEAIANHGHQGPIIAKASVGIVLKMIFEDGFFHADPHPGNVLVSGSPDAPIIGLIDLGMVGRLSQEVREKCIDMMVAAVRQDHLALADALYALGTPTKKIDMRVFRAEVSVLSEKYLGRPLKEIDLAALIQDLVRSGTKFGIEIPTDFLLVGKSLMTMEGVGKEIYPDLDVFGEARPFFLDLLRRRYSPERLGNEVWRAFERFSGAAYDLPQQVREILDDVRLGRLSVKTHDPNLPATVDRFGRRVFAGFVVAAFAMAGAWLLTASVYEWLGVTLIAFAVIVMLGHVGFDLVKNWQRHS